MQQAPVVTLKTGDCCIPQHYLHYEHTLETIQRVLMDCYFDKRFPLFAGEENGNLYVQVGIIGYDNYRHLSRQHRKKIVYGRRWRIERNFPTSELVQTVFLAIQKAREHEVRELLKLTIGGKTATPFSTHQDLPLMAQHVQRLEQKWEQSGQESLKYAADALSERLSFDGGSIQFKNFDKRSTGQVLVDCLLSCRSDSQLPENRQSEFTLILEKACVNELLFELLGKLIEKSNRYVEEHFSYRGYRRFSRDTDIRRVAELSLETRSLEHVKNRQFLAVLEKSNYENDKSRVPCLGDDPFSKGIKTQLSEFAPLDGILPYSSEAKD